MKRRFIAILLVCVLTLSLVYITDGAEARGAYPRPSLTFSGTTATCMFSLTKFGSNISATLELWKGNTRIASWPATAKSSLTISKTKTVTRNATYTLKAYGTIDGVSFTASSTTKTCP